MTGSAAATTTSASATTPPWPRSSGCCRTVRPRAGTCSGACSGTTSRTATWVFFSFLFLSFLYPKLRRSSPPSHPPTTDARASLLVRLRTGLCQPQRRARPAVRQPGKLGRCHRQGAADPAALRGDEPGSPHQRERDPAGRAVPSSLPGAALGTHRSVVSDLSDQQDPT